MPSRSPALYSPTIGVHANIIFITISLMHVSGHVQTLSLEKVRRSGFWSVYSNTQKFIGNKNGIRWLVVWFGARASFKYDKIVIEVND